MIPVAATAAANYKSKKKTQKCKNPNKTKYFETFKLKKSFNKNIYISSKNTKTYMVGHIS